MRLIFVVVTILSWVQHAHGFLVTNGYPAVCAKADFVVILRVEKITGRGAWDATVLQWVHGAENETRIRLVDLCVGPEPKHGEEIIELSDDGRMGVATGTKYLAFLKRSDSAKAYVPAETGESSFYLVEGGRVLALRRDEKSRLPIPMQLSEAIDDIRVQLPEQKARERARLDSLKTLNPVGEQNRAPTNVTAQTPLPVQPATDSRTTSNAHSTAPASQPSFREMNILKRNAILEDIQKRDLPLIFQAWIDADRVDRDPLKRKGLSIVLIEALHERIPSPELLVQMRAFIYDPANTELDRAVLISVLGYAQRKETIDMLLDMVSHSPAEELKNDLLSSLGRAGILNNQDESLSPIYERVWLEGVAGNKDLPESLACSMARLGAASSMETLLTAALAPGGRDDVRRQAARYALGFVTILNDHAVPPLAARLSNDSPRNEASQLAGSILFKMQGPVANRALVAWMQNANASAAPLALNFATNGQDPDLWQAALDPSVPFRSEKNREAIRKGLAAYHAGRVTQP